MAETTGEKTELPTEKRLREARERGQVALSRDMVSTAILAVMMAVSGGVCIRLAVDFRDLLEAIGQLYRADFQVAFRQIGVKGILILAKHTVLFCGCAVGVAILFHLCQTGFLLTFEPLKPTFSKINPAEGMRRICSRRNAFEFLKNTLKVLFLSYLIYRLIAATLPTLLTLGYGSIYDLLPVIGTLMRRLALYSCFGYAVLAAADWAFQRHHHVRQLMMTKSEVKRENKEMEVSQEIRRAQREFARELAQQPQLREGTKRASVVVTNPTHIAIGIRYVPEETPLPQITVSGADRIAAMIRQIAVEEGVPMVEQVPLARALYAGAAVEDYVPEALLEPVAEVLKWVKELNQAQAEMDELDQIKLE